MSFFDIMSAGGSVLGAVPFERINAQQRERRQVGYQKELMNKQMANQMMLNEQGRDLSMDIWNKTNYKAQVGQLEKAGLNPALLYAKGGSGGTTSGGSGGSASSGSAPSVENRTGMDIGSILASAQIASSVKLQKAQARDLNAKAEEQELKNEVRKTYGQEADLFEQSNRRDKNLREGQILFEGKEPDTLFGKGVKAEYEQKTITKDLQDLVRQGTISRNEVDKYKADLAKAKIDPDSNPLVREMMKAMASEGVPVSEILRKVVRFFLD